MMKLKGPEDGMDAVNKSLMYLVDKFPRSKEHVAHIDMQEDMVITKWFPLFLVVCIGTWLAILLFKGDFSLATILQTLCLTFVVFFAGLGVILFKFMSPGPFSKWALVILSALLSALILLFGELTAHFDMLRSITEVLTDAGVNMDTAYMFIIAFLCLFVILLFTPTGVLVVTVAYLRRYMHRLFVSIHNNSKTGTRGAAEGFFMVPDIVDVDKVVLEPVIDYEEFNPRVSAYLWTYITVLGLIVSSYLFLSPYFLDTMTTGEMLSIMLLLSFFLPSMIIPWQIIKDLNANVLSSAPRPYYLWHGARHRLFQSFLTLGMFSMMFLLALYYGYSVEDMLVNYVCLVFPLVCISMMYAFIYTNHFNNILKAVIFARFTEEVEKADSDTEK